MFDHVTVKLIHLTCVALSLSGFLLRGLAALQGWGLPRPRLWRIAPHIVDTVLLLSGIALVVQTAQYPGATGWLNAKLLVLLLYIALGVLTLRPQTPPRYRLLAFVGAIACAAYMVATALTKQATLGI